jgi:hypothetical protein
MDDVTTRFKELYKEIIPECSTLKYGIREGSRLYGILDCMIHGEYKIRGDDFKHRGCKNCAREKAVNDYSDKWKKDCQKIHNNKYDYINTIVGNVLEHSNIKCNSCKTIFKQSPASHKYGKGCPKCSDLKRGDRVRKDINSVIARANIIGFNYDFSKSIYITCKDDIEIICDKGHTFYQSPDELLNAKHGCTVCACAGISKQEKEVFNFVSKYYDCQQNNRKLLGGKELDIYIPLIKVGIEYNGIYWHSDDKIKSSHFDKLNLTSDKNIHLIHIYENDWLNRKEIVENKLRDNLKIKESSYTEVNFCNVDVKEENTEEVINLYNNSTLEQYIDKLGYYSMRLNNEIIGIASYKISKGEKIIIDIVRPKGATQTDFYINFIKHFQNNREVSKILACLDWLDDLFLLNLNCQYDFFVKSPKLHISGNELYKDKKKVKNSTITKAGFAIYRI